MDFHFLFLLRLLERLVSFFISWSIYWFEKWFFFALQFHFSKPKKLTFWDVNGFEIENFTWAMSKQRPIQNMQIALLPLSIAFCSAFHNFQHEQKANILLQQCKWQQQLNQNIHYFWWSPCTIWWKQCLNLFQIFDVGKMQSSLQNACKASKHWGSQCLCRNQIDFKFCMADECQNCFLKCKMHIFCLNNKVSLHLNSVQMWAKMAATKQPLVWAW